MLRLLTERRSLTSKPSGPMFSTFQGFRPPTSNTTYTPNQFFDVVVPHFSRGVVRIVGYLLRKTLGWCDASGNPQEEQIEVSYSELENKAGISRDMIRQALDDALAGRLIDCVREGRPKLAHDAGQSALYGLRWSGVTYTTKPAEFQGFFEGEGNRTDIPNEFFDVVIPNEPLSVIKVVGSVIRHSIGFQTKHGRRRQQVALSFQHIQNYARIGSRSDLAKAVRIALEKNYIIRVEDGVFSPRFPPIVEEGLSTRACYCMSIDTVQMPAFASFESAEGYYLTLFHELVHATGHPDRLNRESLIKHDGFGGKVYSQEELVAEMGAAFLSMETHIVQDAHEQSAAYLQSWLEVLRVKEHRRWIIQAASQASKAASFILGRTTRPSVSTETMETA